MVNLAFQFRINFLDGLRGLAILLVLTHHAYSRWPNIVPYGSTYLNFPLFKFGWLGVQLFFLISGFVIFMTLDKTINFRLFIYKRWLRLFPAMLIASILIFLTAPIFNERPAGSPVFLSLVPGITFIEHKWWSKVLDMDFPLLEGTFWSLYVEFKFYVSAGFIYFVFGRNYLAPCLFILFIGSLFISYMSGKMDNQVVIFMQRVCNMLSLKYFGWFCSGSIFYLYYQTKKEYYFIMAILVAFLSSLSLFLVDGMNSAIGAFTISVLFSASLRVTIVQQFLTQGLFLFFGLISYPLYLLHENAMISMIVKSPDYLPVGVNMFFYPFIPVIFLSLISFFIATKCERKIRVTIESVVQLMKINSFHRR